MKRAVFRRQATLDIDLALDYYLEEASHVAEDFRDEVVRAIEHIQSNPGTGSPRYGKLLEMTGLRHWPLSRFPYSIFYLDKRVQLDVLRLLHQKSDIPVHLQ